MEIFITILIVIFTISIIYKNIKKAINGECNCDSCVGNCTCSNSKHCYKSSNS